MHPKRTEPWFDERLVSITGQEKWSKQDEIISNQINRLAQTKKNEIKHKKPTTKWTS